MFGATNELKYQELESFWGKKNINTRKHSIFFNYIET